jgi:hypothetical protein
MIKNIEVVDSKKAFLDLAIPFNKFPEDSRLFLIYQDGNDFEVAHTLLDEYFMNLENRSYEKITIKIISPKLIEAEIHDLAFLKKLVSLLPVITQFLFLLSNPTLKKETYELLDEIFSSGKILPTQLNFVYTEHIDESFYYYFNHIDVMFRRGLEVDLNNKTSFVSKFQVYLKDIYENLLDENRTNKMIIKPFIKKEDYTTFLEVPIKKTMFWKVRKLNTESTIINFFNQEFQGRLPKIVGLKKLKKTSLPKLFEFIYLPQFEGFTYPINLDNPQSIMSLYQYIMKHNNSFIDFERLKTIHETYTIMYPRDNYPIFCIVYYGNDDFFGDNLPKDHIYFNTGLEHLSIYVPTIKDLPQKKLFDELG